jgi:transposase-like protein
MKHQPSPFKWRHYEPTIILLCVRWYCRYRLSYRDLEEMMGERGLSVDHTTISDCVKTPIFGDFVPVSC